MDEEKPTVCRICVSVWNGVDSCNLEAIAPDRTFSLHFMLETLFPTVFNLEQIIRDVAMNWPTNICLNCKGKVMEAYGLYELCMQSYGRLQKYFEQTQPTAVIFEEAEGAQLDAALTMKEESVGFERDENVMLLKQSSFDQALPLVDCDTGSVQPEENETTTSSPKLRKRRPKAAAANHITVIEELDVLCDDKNILSTATESPAKKRGRRKTVPDVRVKSKPAGHETVDLLQKNVEELETMKDLYRCLLCDAPTYTSPKELTHHLKAVHPDQIHHCEQCPKVFMSAQTFQHHQYCHATGRSFFCTFCDKGFQTEQLLKNHIRTHTHRSEYLCYLCGKEFNNRSNLRQHVKGHSGDRPWACTLCPSRFTTKGGLTMHQNTHTKVKLFSCDTCGSQFNKHYSLIKHKLIHTGERPFGCEVCNMRFTTNYMVKRHMRTHTGEKPFKCTYCERSFTQSNDMVKHMRTHLGSKPYQCDRCDASFRLLTDLRNHYKDHYQAGELHATATGQEDMGIRFTSSDILKLRYEKEKGQQSQQREIRAGLPPAADRN